MNAAIDVRASLNPTASAVSFEAPVVEIEGLSLWYGAKQALRDITMGIPKHRVTAFIGPSGCGKSTLLRCLNRMNDLVDGVRIEGTIRLGGTDIHDPGLDVTELRKRVGMVFQKSNPFPKSIFENVAYGPRVLGMRNRTDLEGLVERSLRAAALWDEVSDRLDDSALSLSGGQQQRLCIARAIAVEPGETFLRAAQRAGTAGGRIEERVAHDLGLGGVGVQVENPHPGVEVLQIHDSVVEVEVVRAEPVQSGVLVVLVEPRGSGNVGSVARAMKNMGASDLALVGRGRTKTFWSRAMAAHAQDILEKAGRFATLREAVADCRLVVGTTCRGGLYRAHSLPPRELAPKIAAAAGREHLGRRDVRLRACVLFVDVEALEVALVRSALGGRKVRQVVQ